MKMMKKKSGNNNNKYLLRGLICYYGKHYKAYFFSPSWKRWLCFNDAKISVIGETWASVVAHCVEGRFQPYLLFYEQQTQVLESLKKTPISQTKQQKEKKTKEIKNINLPLDIEINEINNNNNNNIDEKESENEKNIENQNDDDSSKQLLANNNINNNNKFFCEYVIKFDEKFQNIENDFSITRSFWAFNIPWRLRLFRNNKELPGYIGISLLRLEVKPATLSPRQKKKAKTQRRRRKRRR